MNKQMTAKDVVAQLSDGMTIGIGGWGPRRKPMALVREILRSSLKDLTIVSYGAMVWTALQAATQLAEGGVEAEVVDLRSLVPLDETTLFDSVEKTNRMLVLHEDTRRGGLAGELAALVADERFYFLDAPIRRVTAPDTPVPYAPPLELDYLPNVAQVVEAAIRLVEE